MFFVGLCWFDPRTDLLEEMFSQGRGLGQQAQEDLVSRSRISELPWTLSSLPAPVTEFGVWGCAKPLILRWCIVAEPLQSLALRAARDAVAIIGFDPTHVGPQSSDNRDLEFFANPPLTSQANVSHVANHPFRQPPQPLRAVA